MEKYRLLNDDNKYFYYYLQKYYKDEECKNIASYDELQSILESCAWSNAEVLVDGTGYKSANVEVYVSQMINGDYMTMISKQEADND